MRFYSKILKKAENKVTVALSMGCDSLAIAHFIKTRLPRINLKCFHFNHNIQNLNKTMQEKAELFCKDFDIPLIVKERIGNVDTEADLRKERYSAMYDLGHVITGHHLDDACENYMFNCLRGTPEFLPIPLITEYKDNNLTVIRPFIINNKEDFKKYVKEKSIEKYLVEDVTNLDESLCRRNWLRNNLLPQIEDKGYNIKTIVRKKYEQYNKKAEF